MNNILLERHDRVILVRLNRPQKRNALNAELMGELITALQPLDRDPAVGCFVITGSDQAFAVGADIQELASKSYLEMYHEDFLAGWEAFAALRTPKLAAVAGYALGGGCELAMMCDLIVAADNAQFGQPEIKLGLIPGMGGTQRLTRLIGMAKAMELILTGRTMDATEAARAGLVTRVVPVAQLLPETMATATTIAAYGKTAVMAAREAVQQAWTLGLQDGMRFERRVYHALWATQDAQEGMAAFLEKRPPHFTHQ